MTRTIVITVVQWANKITFTTNNPFLIHFKMTWVTTYQGKYSQAGKHEGDRFTAPKKNIPPRTLSPPPPPRPAHYGGSRADYTLVSTNNRSE